MPQQILNLISFLDTLPMWLRIPIGLGLGICIIMVLRFITTSKASANNRGSIMGPAVITCGVVVAICQLINLSINWGDL